MTLINVMVLSERPTYKILHFGANTIDLPNYSRSKEIN